MPLTQPPGLKPEAILIYGSPGSGKSRGWAQLAQWYRQTETPGHFHVLSTEIGTVERISKGYPETNSDPGFYSNVTSHYAKNWEELISATEKVLDNVSEGDWVVIDELSSPWQWVRDLWERTRPGYKPLNPHDPFAIAPQVEMDWNRIKPVYYAWIGSLINDERFHVYACAHEDVLRVEGGWKDSDETIAMFKYIGTRAVTEKTAPYAVHTVIWARRIGPAKWAYTTVDDPEREYLTDAEVSDFVMDYLLAPGGWQIT